MTRKWALLTLALFCAAGMGLAAQNYGRIPLTNPAGLFAKRNPKVHQGREAKKTNPSVRVQKNAAGPKTAGGPDSLNYRFKDSNEPGGPVFNWIEISGTGTNLNLDDDTYYYGIPFTFTFYGTTYNNIAVGSNGTVYFQDQYLGLGNTAIPNTNTYGVNIFTAVYWDDLYPSGTNNIYYQVIGDKLVVEWYKVPTGNSDSLTFEAILDSTLNTVTFQYLDMQDLGSSATVGIQGSASQPPLWGLQYSYDASSLANNLAILFDQYVPTSHDLKIASIDTPAAVAAPAGAFTPTATINNPGLSPESDFKVYYQILDTLGSQVYLDSAAVTSPDSIQCDSSRQFVFSTQFTPAEWTKYTAVAWTGLADDYSWNDTLTKAFRTWDLDVAASAIVAPTGGVSPDPTIVPQVTFHNSATQNADFTARFIATYGGSTMYDHQLSISGLAGGADTTVSFPDWQGVRLVGTYDVTAYAVMDHDLNSANDTITGTFSSGYNIWVSKAPLSTYQYCQAVATWNGRVYLFGGAPGGTFCNTIQYYDTLTNAWNTAATTMPTNLLGASAITLGDRIFIIGGCETWANPVTNVYCYWPDGDSLTVKASLPTATMEAAAGIWRDSLIYVMGGGNWTMPPINNVQIYNIANDSWSAGTALPISIGTNGGGICGDTIVSVGGYLTDACYYGVIDTTDPTSITWTAGAVYPAGNLSRPSTAVRDHKLYVAAGYNGSNAVATAYYYSPADNAWTQLADKTTATIGAGQAAIVGDWMYVIAGESTGENEALFLGFSATAQPVITDAAPANSSTGVHLLAPVTVSFSKPMDTTTVKYSCVPGSLGWTASWNFDNTAMTLNHDAFTYSMACSVSVDSGKSLDGYDLTAGAVANPFTFNTWEAPEVIVNQLGTMTTNCASQIFYDYTTFSCYVADDINVDAGFDSVKITAVEMEGSYWNGHTGHALDSLYLAFTGDSSASNYPAFSQILWTQNMAQTLFDEGTTGSGYTQFIIYLDNPVVLTPGKSWMTCAPYMAFGYKKNGQYGMNVQTTITGTEASWCNPGGGFGAGSDWQRASAITGSSVDAIFRVLGHTYLASGTEGQPSETALPKVFSLSSSYPNPSRNSSTIKFAMPQAGQVKIDVYNIAGQRVKALVDGNLGAGYHQISWNGRNEAGQKVANGVYMYRMNSGSFQATKKLLMVK